MLGWFVRRWSVEVTFAEVRRHLGVETQRQWSDKAIARTTPRPHGPVLAARSGPVRSSSGLPAAGLLVREAQLTFSDALAAVRHRLWLPADFEISRKDQDRVEIPSETS